MLMTSGTQNSASEEITKLTKDQKKYATSMGVHIN